MWQPHSRNGAQVVRNDQFQLVLGGELSCLHACLEILGPEFTIQNLYDKDNKNVRFGGIGWLSQHWGNGARQTVGLSGHPASPSL